MDKKNFLIVSRFGDSVDIAWRLTVLGHDVKFSIENPEERDEGEIGHGFVEHVMDWNKYTSWADVIIFDNLGYGKIAEQLRSKGKKVIGGTVYTDMLEDDREFGQNELKDRGISIIPNKRFEDLDDAIAFVKENPGRYVIKPCGDKILTHGLLFVGEEEDGRDVIQILGDYKKAWSHKIDFLQLQKRVMGVEIGIGAFFNGKEFVYPININFEHKKLFPGDVGPSTGEMGTAMFWSGPNKIFNNTLKKMAPRLAQEGYVGYIDLNCIVNGHGVFPLEFTSRFGYPTISIQQEGMLDTLDEFLYGLVNQSFTKFKTKSGFQVGVCIMVPPFPFEDDELFKVKSKGSIVYFKKETNKSNPEGVHILEVKNVNGEWLVSGTEGWPLIVCGSGSTMKQAQKQAYQRVKNIMIPNMYYRSDIGDRWSEESDKLHNWGYLREN